MIVQAVFLVFFLIVFILYMFMASAYMWEILIYPFWKGVFDKIRGLSEKAKDHE